MNRRVPVVLLWGLVGCGGYGPDTPLTELEPEERTEVCEGYAIQGPVDATCGFPVPVTVDALDAASCAEVWMPEDCDATVSEWEACQAAIAADPCALQVGDEACLPVQMCGVDLWSAALGIDGRTSFDDMTEDDIVAVCEATNDYEPFQVTCEDPEVPDLIFDANTEACIGFGFGGCGDVAQVFECQLDLLTAGTDNCVALPESCLFIDCS